MNILFTRFPFESLHGGAEVQTVSLMKELKRRGHNVAFLGSCPTLTVLCEQHSIPFAEIDIGPPPVSKGALLRFIIKKRKIQKKLEDVFEQFADHGLDAICMLSLSEKILITQKAIDKNIRVLWIEHDSVGKWLSKNPFLSQLKKLSNHVLTIGVSEASRNAFIELGWNENRVIAIPNGIDPTRFSESANKNKMKYENNTSLIVGCVARLHKQKGLDVLIRSIVNLPQVELTIVGMGEEKSSLLKLADKLQISKRIKILDKVGKLGDFYRSLDIFVLPSRTQDPFGLVAAEAMCCGVPVIVTTACGITQEITDGKDGIVVQADSSDAMQEALSFLISDEDRRIAIGEAGRRKAISDFTIEGMVDEYERYLQN